MTGSRRQGARGWETIGWPAQITAQQHPAAPIRSPRGALGVPSCRRRGPSAPAPLRSSRSPPCAHAASPSLPFCSARSRGAALPPATAADPGRRRDPSA
eukprot:317066-Chlamydomonas_euryale.AAC.2